jgi:hypothetical protein
MLDQLLWWRPALKAARGRDALPAARALPHPGLRKYPTSVAGIVLCALPPKFACKINVAHCKEQYAASAGGIRCKNRR